jgi:MFS family permease
VGKTNIMMRKILRKLLHKRHFWRQASFSEIAELYASRMLRMLALNMTAAFASIYLYQIGYSVFFIALLWAAFYFLKFAIAMPLAAMVARIGPKHAILISNVLYIPALIALALLPTFGTLVLIGMVIFQASSSMLYQIAYSVDFSKVKSVKHAGKEIAYMNILEKITTGLSPLIGGLLAFALGPQAVIIIAAGLFSIAALPLFKTAEQELPNQRLAFRGFPWRLVTRNIPSEMALGFDAFTSGTVWTLFTAITIIGIAADNEVYATNGILLSVVLLSALGASYAYGRLIDRRRGKELLQIAAIVNSITHFLRPFIGTPVAIAGLNIANEAATAGYGMSYTRGNFDNADLSGRRTTYIGIMEALANLGAALAAVALAALTLIVSEARSMEYFFFIAAAVVLLIATARFPLYRR